jgi:hypothetical protein
MALALVRLTDTRREQMTSFQSKATGWFTVAAGATLLAAGETWRVVQYYSWPVWLFWVLVVVMLAAAVLNTAVQMINDARTRRPDGAEPAPAAGHPAGLGHGQRRVHRQRAGRGKVRRHRREAARDR